MNKIRKQKELARKLKALRKEKKRKDREKRKMESNSFFQADLLGCSNPNRI